MATVDKPVASIPVADLIEALRALKGEDDATLQKRAQYEAEAHARLTKRENEQGTGLSAYRPDGSPTVPLKCEMFWVGFPMDPDLLSAEEVALFNQVDTDGEFLFHRTDGSQEKLTVKIDRKASGEPRRMEFFFACRDQLRHNLPSTAAILREAYGFPSADQQELARLRSLVGASA